MAKNIVICMDGTGNHGGKTRGTNVWRVFNAVDRYRANRKQVTYYDDGVGSDGFRLIRWICGAFGFGLSRKICNAYTFLVANYEKGDRIYMFGFSRGAFTVRSLAGMICRCGLLERRVPLAARQSRERAVRRVLKAYRSEKEISRSRYGDDPEPAHIRECLGIGDLPLRRVPVHFIGVWDTVDAMGGTFGGLSALDWLSRKLSGKRWWGFHDLNPHRDIRYAYQALALDDERRTYHPKVWDRPNSDAVGDNGSNRKSRKSDGNGDGSNQVVEQVWFAGAHANVGGGYPKDALALVPLLWMMRKAHRCKLRFLKEKWAAFEQAADPHGRLYDSRAGLAAIYRYGRREVICRAHVPAIHESVFERIRHGTDEYAPRVIGREGYDVVPNDPRSDFNKKDVECGSLEGPGYWLTRFARTRARLYWLSLAFGAFVSGLLLIVALLAWPAELVRFFVPGLPANLVEIAFIYPVPGIILVVIALLIGWMIRLVRNEERESAFRRWAWIRPEKCACPKTCREPKWRARAIDWISPLFVPFAVLLTSVPVLLLVVSIVCAAFIGTPTAVSSVPETSENNSEARPCCAGAGPRRLGAVEAVQVTIAAVRKRNETGLLLERGETYAA